MRDVPPIPYAQALLSVKESDIGEGLPTLQPLLLAQTIDDRRGGPAAIHGVEMQGRNTIAYQSAALRDREIDTKIKDRVSFRRVQLVQAVL